jgi:hypothetical protein
MERERDFVNTFPIMQKRNLWLKNLERKCFFPELKPIVFGKMSARTKVALPEPT